MGFSYRPCCCWCCWGTTRPKQTNCSHHFPICEVSVQCTHLRQPPGTVNFPAPACVLHIVSVAVRSTIIRGTVGLDGCSTPSGCALGPYGPRALRPSGCALGPYGPRAVHSGFDQPSSPPCLDDCILQGNSDVNFYTEYVTVSKPPQGQPCAASTTYSTAVQKCQCGCEACGWYMVGKRCHTSCTTCTMGLSM